MYAFTGKIAEIWGFYAQSRYMRNHKYNGQKGGDADKSVDFTEKFFHIYAPFAL